MKKIFEDLRIVLFALFIFLPLIVQIGGWQRVSEKEFLRQENRKPNPLPDRFWDCSGMEKWYNDHFGLRRNMISFNSRMRYSLGLSSKPKQVIIGKQDFLFLGNDFKRVIDQYRGVISTRHSTVNGWLKEIKLNREWLQKRGVHFMIVVVPNKHSIYPEHLPSWCTKIRKSSDMDDRISKLKKMNLDIVDLRIPLITAKARKKKLLYYKKDSHWNSVGAFIAYQATIQSLKKYFPKLAIPQIKKIDSKGRTQGYLAKMLSLQEDLNEPELEVILKDPLDKIFVEDFEGNAITYSLDKINWRKKFVLTNTDAPKAPVAIFLRDSFGTALVPFYGQTFSKSIYIPYKVLSGVKMSELLKKYKPNMVILQIVERNFRSIYMKFL